MKSVWAMMSENEPQKHCQSSEVRKEEVVIALVVQEEEEEDLLSHMNTSQQFFPTRIEAPV